ncbi:MAG TPA: hypothetical protein VNX40_09255 [Mucilaginibacter sp.]|jgi:hypothetical protein|nr:hypothetical protein [Mucilaginibacter sp.]
MATWRHKIRERTDNTPDPTEAAFFSNEMVGNISNALVREGCQNVLDEIKDKSKPAIVRIFLSGQKYAVPASYSNELLKDLIPHLKAEGNGIISTQLPDLNSPMPYLIFEDFNTEGLDGDPFEFTLHDSLDNSKPHNFYFFWRTYGRSGKLANKMGSWGVGKSVFSALSRINAFWAFTIRESDKDAYLIGQSILKTHNLKDRPVDCGYFPYGYYANYEKDGFAIPEDDEGKLRQFISHFKMRRELNPNKGGRSEDTGLSLIIPFPQEEVKIDSLLFSTIQQFFYPILLNKLIVSIVHEDEEMILTRNTIKMYAEKIDFGKLNLDDEYKNQFLSLFEFVKWINKLNTADYITLKFNDPKRAYEWRKKELFKDYDLLSLQKRFETGDALAFNVPVKFQPEAKQAEIRYYKAFIKKDDAVKEPESIFIRDSLTITGVKSLKRKGVRGLVIIEDEELVTFFGQAEGPAHTGWHAGNFRVQYNDARECLSFVQRTLDALYSVLLLPLEGLDKDLLKDFFFIEIPEVNDKGAASHRPGEKDPIPPVKIPPGLPKPYRMTQISSGGFKIVNNPNFPDMPPEINVDIAYMRDDNAFAKYSKLDFDINDLDVTGINVNIVNKKLNNLKFQPTYKSFEIKVEGFDTKRDLIININ